MNHSTTPSLHQEGKKYVNCRRCRELFCIEPFHNMLANGELKYSHITLYGEEFNLCPKCTNKIYNFIIEGASLD